jgi:hypothetical protein
MRRRGAPRSKTKKRKKSEFEVEWVKFPLRWAERLRNAKVGPATYNLAFAILVENFKLNQMAVKEIILSAQVTRLSWGARKKAINNLVRLNLIKVKRGRGKAVRVVDLYI